MKNIILIGLLFFAQLSEIDSQNIEIKEVINNTSDYRQIKNELLEKDSLMRGEVKMIANKNGEREYYICKETKYDDLKILQLNLWNGEKDLYTIIEKDNTVLFSSWYSSRTNQLNILKRLPEWDIWKEEFKVKTGYELIEIDEIMFPKKFIQYTMSSCNNLDPEKSMLKRYNENLQNKNYAEFKKWIWSLNTEIQLYGVIGLIKLKMFGFKITEEIRERMIRIKTDNQIINHCNVCTISQEYLGEGFDIE